MIAIRLQHSHECRRHGFVSPCSPCLLILIVWVMAWFASAPVHADTHTHALCADTTLPQIDFAVKELRTALSTRGYPVNVTGLDALPSAEIPTRITMDHVNVLYAGQNDEVTASQVYSKSPISPLGQLVEAENMNLTRYKVDKNESCTFVKLTNSTGMAEFSSSLPSGNYDIDVRYLSESVGQNTYVMTIADNQIVAWLGKDRDDQWHMLSEQKWHAPRNIAIKTGDDISIEALSDNGSLAIFDYIKFTASTRLSSPTPPTNTSTPPTATTTDMPIPQADVITVYPSEYAQAIKNPLKGFRPKKQDHEYGTLIKNYFKWNELENLVSDDVNKIKNVCNIKWKGIENKNVKIIPRVYLAWPGQKSGWPADMTTGDFTSDRFKHRVVAFIKKLGQAWDTDSRVAYVEMGLIGEWGEMEFPDTSDDIKEAIAAQFAASFQNKLVMIRWPNTYNDHIYNFGYYWDSFAHHDQAYCAFHINNTAPKWKTAVIGGEVAYNWGNLQIQPGRNPYESLTNPVHRDYILDTIRKLHANHLGWISNYDQSDATVRAGAEIVQKALGYRFVITEVTYPKRIETDAQFTVSFKVKNTGSSPFYYNWPVEVSLLDPNTKQAVWKKQCTNIDIRNWLPGDQWDDSTHSYTIPAETYTAHQTLSLTGVSPGEYILALAILDPAGNRPCTRFAIKNYYHGGRHPIGQVGVDCTLDAFSIPEFDDLQSDNSLSYDKTKAGNGSRPNAHRPVIDNTQSPYTALRCIPMQDTQWTEGFFAQRFDLAATRMLPALEKGMLGDCTANLNRLKEAAGLAEAGQHGAPWGDGDNYKWIESMAHVYNLNKDPALLRKMDAWIEIIGKAMEPDGYISTNIMHEKSRRFDRSNAHEMYNMGHLLTAACIHYRATGKQNFLNIAKKNADFLCRQWKAEPAHMARFPWNPSAFMGMAEMYRTTRDKDYLELLETMINNRGSRPNPERNHAYGGTDQTQDRIPLRQEHLAVGHAVTGSYYYCGAADLYAEIGDPKILAALERIWKDIHERKTDITLGVAMDRHSDSLSPRGDEVHENFANAPYLQPNLYSETCANIAAGMFNYRMFMLTGEAKYADWTERMLYNTLNSGVDLQGQHWFYCNPVTWDGTEGKKIKQTNGRDPNRLVPGHQSGVRWAYMNCYCCPPSVTRTTAKIHNWFYNISDDGALWVNFYGGNRLMTELTHGSAIALTQETDYPWDGHIKITLNQVTNHRPISLHLRIPNWTQDPVIMVNGVNTDIRPEPGTYLEVYRYWSPKDEIELSLPMPVHLMEANPKIAKLRGKVAVMRGPMVYCMEFPVNKGGKAIFENGVYLPQGVELTPEHRPAFLGGVTVLKGTALTAAGQALYARTNDSVDDPPQEVTWEEGQLYRPMLPRKQKMPDQGTIQLELIPYYAWANRGLAYMDVWIPLAQ